MRKRQEIRHKNESNQGITLIALVITILVLLILAGISIALLAGENSVINKAKKAKEEAKKAEYLEELIVIGDGLQPDRVIQQWDNQTYMDEYENQIKNDDMFKEAKEIKQLTDSEKIKIQVIVKEGWVYWVTENGVKYVGRQGEDIPPTLDLETGNIKIEYEPSKWTNQKVKVRMSTTIEGYTLQYSLDGKTWKNYKETDIIEVENNNQAIYARLINAIGEEGGAASKKIEIIDRLSPKPFSIQVTQNVNLIVLTGTTTDQEATSIDGCSGNLKYYFSKDNGKTWEPEEGKGNGYYIFKDLSEGEYTLRMKVVDQAGNERLSTNTVTEKITGVYVSLKGTTLSFYNEEEKAKTGADTYYGNVKGKYYTSTNIPWYDSRNKIQKVVIVDEIYPTNMSYYFADFSSLTTIENIDKIRTDNVTLMSGTFRNCSKLTTLDVSKFNTSKVASMWGMFSGCSGLTSLDLSGFDTSNVTNIGSMFSGCSNLTNLNIANMKTDKVTAMTYTFSNCSKLKTINVSQFNTANVTDMQFMFNGCVAVTTLDVSNFDTSQVTNMNSLFSGCTNLTSIDVSKFDTSQVTNMQCMFADCTKLKTLNVSNFKTENVTTMDSMFAYCSGLTSLNVSSFDTSKVTSMYQMFRGCTILATLDLSKFNTANVTRMDLMFVECKALKTLNLSKFNTSKVTTMDRMFYFCTGLQSVTLTSFNTANVTNMNAMFQGDSQLTTLDLSSFNTNKVTIMSTMFGDCSKLTKIYVGANWKLAATRTNMFTGCGTSTTTKK